MHEEFIFDDICAHKDQDAEESFCIAKVMMNVITLVMCAIKGTIKLLLYVVSEGMGV